MCRSGDEVSDGGHMIASSIGQAILSSIKLAVSCRSNRSGTAHITPIT